MVWFPTQILISTTIWFILPRIAICGGAGRQDEFLKNISQILDDLLKDYDSSQHPNLRVGKPTTIRTNILIRSMGPISEHDMDFSVDCYYRQYWRDPRLSFRGPVESLSLNIKMLEQLWRPDTYFHNGKNSYLHTITVPNKLLRIDQLGEVLYSMRLTIKAKCPMCLRNFPLDTQSCPLLIGSYAFPSRHILYSWDSSDSVSFVPGMALSQFDLISFPTNNFSISRKEGDFSVLQVNFHLVRHAGFFLIQVYVPCVLIVVLSFVSFWINREATSDRVGLGITAVLTLSTISLDSRTDLPKVHYATALDWFLLMSFGYCMATLLEFAAVHKGSGEAMLEEENKAQAQQSQSFKGWTSSGAGDQVEANAVTPTLVYSNDGHFGWKNAVEIFDTPSKSTESKETQTEKRSSCFRQFLKCVVADQAFRRQRQQSASRDNSTNSVSRIDTISRILFPFSFLALNILYWVMYTYLHDNCERKLHV